MKTPLAPGEAISRSGAANMYRGAEAVGGHLHLTNQRLVFESHAFNVQTGVSAIPRDAIAGVEPRAKKLLFIPVNNHMAVRMRDGSEAVFVVNDRDGWLRALGSGA